MGNEFNQFSKDMILSRKAKATNFGLKAKEASDHNVTMSVFATCLLYTSPSPRD